MSTHRQKTKIVLVGLGRMGKNHFRVTRESQRFELTAVVDAAAPAPDPSQLGGARFARSIEEIDDLAYDAAIVATPTVTHFDVASALARRGKHLLVEKPIASSFKRCEELVALCSQQNVKLAVGHVERFNPAVRKLREVIKAGWVGTPIHFSVTRVGGYPETVTQENNVLLDLAVHDLDVLRSLIGSLKLEASVCHATVQAGICDTAEILLSSAAGVSATVHVNWITPTKIRSIRVTGTRAVCFVDYILQTCTLVGGDLLRTQVDQSSGFEQLLEMYKNTDRIEFGIKKEEPLKVQLEQFYQLISGGEAGELCLGADASRAVLLAERAIREGTTNARDRAAGIPASAAMANETDDWV